MIGVVAHTARAQQAHQLMEQTGAAYMSIDDGTLGCNRNHKRVWAAVANYSTDDWCVVLEDDAVPVDDFTTQLPQALAMSPAPIVSLYLGRHHIPTVDWEKRKKHALAAADTADAHWLTTNYLLHAVAVAVKTSYIPTMLHHLNQLPNFLPIDEAITHFAHNYNLTVGYTTPSLCDHADQPTLFRHYDKLDRPPGRVAYHTGTRPTWNNKAVAM